MTDDEVERLLPDLLPATAPRTVRQRNALLTELRLIRERGYAAQVEEFVDGTAAVAAPVLDAGGRVLATLSIAGPTGRFDERAWADFLMPASNEMSRLCGYRGRREDFNANGRKPAAVVAGASAWSRKEALTRRR
jgi:DNA-binding IclR family transcriptional regulator